MVDINSCFEGDKIQFFRFVSKDEKFLSFETLGSELIQPSPTLMTKHTNL